MTSCNQFGSSMSPSYWRGCEQAAWTITARRLGQCGAGYNVGTWTASLRISWSRLGGKPASEQWRRSTKRHSGLSLLALERKKRIVFRPGRRISAMLILERTVGCSLRIESDQSLRVCCRSIWLAVRMRLADEPPSFIGQFRIASARDRRRMVRHLRDGLARLAERVGQPYVEVWQVQLVAQICGSLSFQSWRQARETTWRRQGGRYTTRGWPLRLPADHCAVVLLPLPAGRISTTVRDHPPLVATPVFAHGPLAKSAGYHDALLGLVTKWVTNPGFGVSAQLAPPIVETVVHGRILERRVESFGLDWPSPPAQGLS